MKHIFSALLSVVLCLALTAPASAAKMETQNVQVDQYQGSIVVNGVTTYLQLSEKASRSALICDDTVYIPLMAAGQWLGVDMVWDQETRCLTIIHNGQTPVYFSRRNLREMGAVWGEWDGLDNSAQLCGDVTITVDGEEKRFINASGKECHLLQMQDHILLPLEVVCELGNKQMLEFPNGYDQLLHIFDVPTPEELEDADVYLSAIRSRLTAVRGIVEGEAPKSEEELTDKVKQAQTHVKAVLDLPAPAFQGMTYFAGWLRENAQVVLSESIDPYLPEEESSGAAEAQGLTPRRYASGSPGNDTPGQKWDFFTWDMLKAADEVAVHTTTYFLGLENMCATSEAFLAKVSGRSAPEVRPQPEEQAPSVTIPVAVAADAAAYTDAADVRHWEAVAALAKLGVMTGKDDGAFHPEDILTRAEAAKLLTVLGCGGRGAHLDGRHELRFSDTGDHWSLPYIEYCADLGVLVGRGDGRFDPDAPVTALELCKMALVTLGYDPAAYELTGNRWAEKTDELARQVAPGLYSELDGVLITQPVTRDDAAQILYNALQCTPKCVKPVNPENGGEEVTWQYVDATKPDGTPSTLLYERFGLDGVGGVSVQPGQ